MSFEFVYHPRPSLPSLAWLASISRNHSRVDVYHGLGVEARQGFFVEGAWDGRFSDGAFDDAEVFLGSGGRANTDHVTFACASHPLERLYSRTVGESFLIANSLPLLLASHPSDISTDDRDADLRLMSFLDGTRRGCHIITGLAAFDVEVHWCSNLTLRSDLSRIERGKPDFSRRPTSYGEYLDFLKEASIAIAANASDEGRVVQYRPLATVSSGYDSPACAVLAKIAGADSAVTFTAARSNFKADDDSGARIADTLGLRVLEFDRTSYLHNEVLLESEFLCLGTGGEDVVMSSFEPALPCRILFTGFLGDTVWGLTTPTKGSGEYRMTYPAGASLAEYRLRVGFIHFPVPQAHQRLHPWIQRISQSKEMFPWRIGGSYDRPIPRRIAEERGVPRHWFGRAKKAVTQPFYHREALDRILSPRTLEAVTEFRRFIGSNPSRASLQLEAVVSLLERASWRIPPLRTTALRLLRRVSVPESHSLFLWSLQEMVKRYQEGLVAPAAQSTG